MTSLFCIITSIHMAALAMKESADKAHPQGNPLAVGRDGEITAYQMLPAEARREMEKLRLKNHCNRERLKGWRSTWLTCCGCLR